MMSWCRSYGCICFGGVIGVGGGANSSLTRIHVGWGMTTVMGIALDGGMVWLVESIAGRFMYAELGGKQTTSFHGNDRVIV